jgi:hypothetical protein
VTLGLRSPASSESWASISSRRSLSEKGLFVETWIYQYGVILRDKDIDYVTRQRIAKNVEFTRL